MIFKNFIPASVTCRAGMLRANCLHHLYVMQAQDDVAFPWHEKVVLKIQIWLLDRICSPITD